MKILRIGTISLFGILLLLPILFFDFTPGAISEIDNRALAENPLEAEGDLTENIESYINDRIGFRDKMILAYTVINDALFDKMVHPIYTYGKDGYVFGAGITTTNTFGEFHVAYADMVKAIQDYCEARGTPFLFVFDPAKPAVLTDKLAAGINYNREWVDLFLAELDARGVNYVDNTVTLKEATEKGETVFNQKYDANHWNAIGAYYGTRAALERLQEQVPSVHVGDFSEYAYKTVKKTSLLVSEFPIDEDVPSVNFQGAAGWRSGYEELRLDSQHRTFGYRYNPERMEEGCPRALVFQGSYMNGYGLDYFLNAFGEYIYIHDYQNVIDFSYYYNIFEPDCVVFEVGEYTLSNSYFNYERMKSIDYAPSLASLSEEEYREVTPTEEEITVTVKDSFTEIEWKTDKDSRFAWVKLGDTIYDAEKTENGYLFAVKTKNYTDATPVYYVYNE